MGYNFGMAITQEEIKHIATLARLHLTEEEVEKYEKQLTKILDFFSLLREVENINSSSVRTEVDHTILRKDESNPCPTSRKILQNSIDVEKDQFKIPPVF